VNALKRLLRALPDVARTMARLATDPALPRSVKLALAAALVYLVSPLDLLPDFLPVVGYLDDVLVGAIVVDGLLSHVDRAVVLRYWPGTPDSLDKIARIARFLAAWVPRRLKRRLFAPGR
jgi:uncharacterized membrane protein YkvA (DUF1232 family)